MTLSTGKVKEYITSQTHSNPAGTSIVRLEITLTTEERCARRVSVAGDEIFPYHKTKQKQRSFPNLGCGTKCCYSIG